MTFAEKVRELREAKGLSEAKLAEASGLSFATVHNYCQGRRKPSYGAVVKLARALGCDCTAFEDCPDVFEEDGRATAQTKPPAKKLRRRSRKA